MRSQLRCYGLGFEVSGVRNCRAVEISVLIRAVGVLGGRLQLHERYSELPTTCPQHLGLGSLFPDPVQHRSYPLPVLRGRRFLSAKSLGLRSYFCCVKMRPKQFQKVALGL